MSKISNDVPRLTNKYIYIKMHRILLSGTLCFLIGRTLGVGVWLSDRVIVYHSQALKFIPSIPGVAWGGLGWRGRGRNLNVDRWFPTSSSITEHWWRRNCLYLTALPVKFKDQKVKYRHLVFYIIGRNTDDLKYVRKY